MKKLPLVLLAILTVIVSCGKNESQQKSLSGTSKFSISLNGVTKTNAFLMIQHFDESRFGDQHPNGTNIWFDSLTVHRIANLLQLEGADGIRIYFASALNETVFPLKNTIVLVATKTNGKNPGVPSGKMHLDYYEHSASNILFSNLKSISGIVSYGTASKNTVLYNTCTTCDASQKKSTNIHQLSRTEAEQMVQGFGDHPINTISEWFDLGLFQTIIKDNKYDGLRIYFATKSQGSKQPGRDVFVLIKTVPGDSPSTHVDYFGTSSNNAKDVELADGGQDNGEQCQPNCQ